MSHDHPPWSTTHTGIHSMNLVKKWQKTLTGINFNEAFICLPFISKQYSADTILEHEKMDKETHGYSFNEAISI